MRNMTHLGIRSHLCSHKLLSMKGYISSIGWQWLSILCCPACSSVDETPYFFLHGTVCTFSCLKRDLSFTGNVTYWPNYCLKWLIVFAACVNVVSPERETRTDIVLKGKQSSGWTVVCLHSLSLFFFLSLSYLSGFHFQLFLLLD